MSIQTRRWGSNSDFRFSNYRTQYLLTWWRLHEICANIHNLKIFSRNQRLPQAVSGSFIKWWRNRGSVNVDPLEEIRNRHACWLYMISFGSFIFISTSRTISIMKTLPMGTSTSCGDPSRDERLAPAESFNSDKCWAKAWFDHLLEQQTEKAPLLSSFSLLAYLFSSRLRGQKGIKGWWPKKKVSCLTFSAWASQLLHDPRDHLLRRFRHDKGWCWIILSRMRFVMRVCKNRLDVRLKSWWRSC